VKQPVHQDKMIPSPEKEAKEEAPQASETSADEQKEKRDSSSEDKNEDATCDKAAANVNHATVPSKEEDANGQSDSSKKEHAAVPANDGNEGKQQQQQQQQGGEQAASQTNMVLHPNPNDVLLGRGKPFQNHHGNQEMLRVVDMYRVKYHQAERAYKHEIIEEVLGLIRSQGGRFLERVDERENSYYNEVTDSVAYRKIGHAFRSNARIKSANRSLQAQFRTNGNGSTIGGLPMPVGFFPHMGGGPPMFGMMGFTGSGPMFGMMPGMMGPQGVAGGGTPPPGFMQHNGYGHKGPVSPHQQQQSQQDQQTSHPDQEEGPAPNEPSKESEEG
jgi:hypothetical protein